MDYNINRRDFLKIIGAGALFATTGCRNSNIHEGSHKPTAANGTMTYRTNPSTGDKVSLLGYGCMRLPHKKIPDGNGTMIDQEEINRSVDHAIKHGINYFDTSPAYCEGNSESAMGIALSRHPRNSYFIATKLSNFDKSTWSRNRSIEMYRNSLKYLRTDYIDYMLLHAIGMGGMAEFNSRYIDNSMLDFLMGERESGRIRNLGFSYHGDVTVFDHLLSLHDKYKWDFVQIQLNYVDWRHAKEVNARNTNADYLYSELKKRNIPAVIMEPLLGGRLAKVNKHIAGAMKQRRPNDSIASWAFRFAGSHEGVLTVLSGMTYMEHLIDNLHTFSPLEPLSDSELQFLEETAQEILSYPTIPCNNCNYCMPCPYGLNIPAILLHYNKCVNEGNVTHGINDPNYAKARRAFLVGYDRSVPKLRQADRCISCGECTKHCPQSINIPAQMARIDAYVESLKRNPG